MFQPIVFKNHIKARCQIDDERIWDIKRRWEKALAYVARDIPGFLAYLRDEMTEEELGWFSDVYEREFPVKLVPGYPESLFAVCHRLPQCARRLGVREMLARNGFIEPGLISMTANPASPASPASPATRAASDALASDGRDVRATEPVQPQSHDRRRRETC